MFHDFIRSRRSVREFAPSEVPTASVLRILDTATWAPSAHNRQPWRFAAVTSLAAKIKLADALAHRFLQDLQRDGVSAAESEARVQRSRLRITSSPVAIVLCMDRSEMDVYADEERAEAERTMSIQSTANAGICLLLAAHAEGLAGCWNCAPLFAPDIVRATLNIPLEWEPQALFLLGRPRRLPDARPRKSVQSITIFA